MAGRQDSKKRSREPKPDEKSLPYNPIDAAMRSQEHARRTIRGVLESYNTNYDPLAEIVQNSMDALEDAAIQELPPPYFLEITIDLKDNTIAVLDTGVGMSQAHVCEAFAPSATWKDLPYVATKRGERYPYRGYKGVGLTFLAYGTDDIKIHSRQNGQTIKGRMKNGRDWATGNITSAPILKVDPEATPLDKYKRGTYIKVQFSKKTKPAILSSLGSAWTHWAAIIRTRTAAGQVLIGQDPLASFKVRLSLVTKDGLKSKHEIDPVFYYPHLVARNPPFRFLDVAKYHQENPNVVDHRPEAKLQDAVYLWWHTDEIKHRLGEEKASDFAKELAEFKPSLYAFRPYQSQVWSEINEVATQQSRTHHFGPGLVLAVNHQRIAEAIRIKTSRSEFLAERVFVLVHFERASPDQGRKTLQPGVTELAQLAADEAVQFLAKQTGLLRPAGQKTTAAQRAVERDHEDWVDNVKAHARENPLTIPPVSYASMPLEEQDVVGLFHQMSALGIFPGLKIFATSAGHTYDCYLQFVFKKDVQNLRYVADGNPLGLSSDVLTPGETSFVTKGLTVEFKNSLDSLIEELNSPLKRKSFNHIDICVCWNVTDKSRWYILDLITEGNLHERQFPGVTHVLRKEGESHVIQVVVLEEIVKKIVAGQIQLPMN
jgi:hypothetical protein